MAIWTCQTCRSRWESTREPLECGRCRGRLLVSDGGASDFRQTPPEQPSFAASAFQPSQSSGSTLFRWYTCTFWGSFAGSLLGFVLCLIAGESNTQELAILGLVVLLIGLASGIAAAVLSFIIVYRGWSAIQPLRHMVPSEQGMPTPGKAIGFLFIPVFNLYWSFVAYYGFARRANHLLADRRSDAVPANVGLAVTFSVLLLCSIVPVVGLILALPLSVVSYIVHRDFDRITRLLPASA